MRFILFIALIIVLMLAFRMFAGRLQSLLKTLQHKQPGTGSGHQNHPGEAMVRCAHCGIHLPRSEAYTSQGQTWCSEEHARLGHK